MCCAIVTCLHCQSGIKIIFLCIDFDITSQKWLLYVSFWSSQCFMSCLFPFISVILWPVVGQMEQTSAYSWSRFCTVIHGPMAGNYQLSHLRSGRDSNSRLRAGRWVCYHCTSVTPCVLLLTSNIIFILCVMQMQLMFILIKGIQTHNKRNVDAKVKLTIQLLP